MSVFRYTNLSEELEKSKLGLAGLEAYLNTDQTHRRNDQKRQQEQYREEQRRQRERQQKQRQQEEHKKENDRQSHSSEKAKQERTSRQEQKRKYPEPICIALARFGLFKQFGFQNAPDLDIQLLKTRYRILIKKYHPDRNGEQYLEEFKTIQMHYDMLKEFFRF